MNASKRNFKKKIFFALIIGMFCFNSVDAQTIISAPDTIENRALVLHALPPSNYFKIPELKYDPDGEDPFLQINFFVKYAKYKIGKDSVKMRSYVYPEMPIGMGQLSEGPTIRVKRNDRFSVSVHNQLPLNGDRNYLGSMPKDLAVTMDRDSLTKEIKDAMLKASVYRKKKSWIKPENLEFASMKVETPGEKWVVYGHSKCECPPEARGTCEKDTIFYDVEKMWNLGTQTDALRIYSTHEHDESNHNEPHGFNVTNFHTHGFHVSPLQDDILRRLDPGYSTYYTYDLKDHTPGTMWYHPHIHGSTALQVASGMSGVIIIEDDPEVLASFPALKAASLPEHEKVMVFNQLIYDKETGELPDFNTLVSVVKSPPSGTTINGVVKPIIDIERGEVQRWRMLHSGYTTNIGLFFGDNIEAKQIAVDGITFNEARTIRSAHLSTGNRTDVLIKVSDKFVGGSGSTIPIYSLDYLPECEYFPDSKQCGKMVDADEKHIIAYLRIGEKPMEPAMTFPTRLPGPGVGHEDIKPEQLVNADNPRKTIFEIFPALPKTNPVTYEYGVNGKVYDGNIISEKPLMGTKEAWIFDAKNFEHPFHIHINPFQVVEFGGVKLKTPMWKDVALVRQWDKNGYGTWKGKLPIQIKQGEDVETLSSGAALAYTYYQRYWGGFVLHCHILDHEDRGMMQRVNIVEHIEDSDLTPTEKRRARDNGYERH